MISIFITGTSTEVGKTFVTCQLLQALQQENFSVLGIKPLASGCEETPEGLRNSDALQLQNRSSIKVDYSVINPLTFKPSIAPHIAAYQANQNYLTLPLLKSSCEPALKFSVDILLIEGIGGWLVPINHSQTMADFVKEMSWPVILVIGMQLGCLNHALLTAESIRAKELPLLGWIANFMHPEMAVSEENLATLHHHLPEPCLGVVDYGGQIQCDSLIRYLKSIQLLAQN